MKKKTIAILSLVTACSIATTVLLAVNGAKNFMQAKGDPVTYAMYLNENNHLFNNYIVSDAYNRGYTKTYQGTEIEFEYTSDTNVTTTAAFIEFGTNGGEIHNIDPLNGLIRLTYSCNKDLTLNYGFSPDDLRYSKILPSTGHSWEDDGSFIFTADYGFPSYFKISCNQEYCQIYRFALYYSCIPSVDPYRSEGTWEYTIHDMEVTITGYHIDSEDIPTDGVLVVPPTFEGKLVYYINPDVFANVPWVTHIVIPFVGQSLNDTAAKSHEFGSIFGSSLPPGQMNYIPMQQHDNTWFIPQGLKTVTVIHGNYTSGTNDYTIPSYGFYGADNLTKITISGPISKDEPVGFYTRKIGKYSFANCTNLEELYLPATINNIDFNAFAGNENLIIRSYGSFPIGDAENPNFVRVTENYYATVTYKSIKYDLYIVDGVIYANALGALSPMPLELHLEEEIPFNGRRIDCKRVANRAFSDCTNFERVYLPAGMEKVGHLAFKGLYRASILVGDSISDSVYLSDWDKDTGIVVPNYNGEDSFAQLHVSYLPLTEGYFADFIIDSNVEELQLDQFDINVPIYVSAYFAENIHSITSLSLPKNLTLGDASFINCANLSIVQYAGTVEEWNALVSSGRIGVNSFANTQVTEIICNGGSTPVTVAFSVQVA